MAPRYSPLADVADRAAQKQTVLDAASRYAQSPGFVSTDDGQPIQPGQAPVEPDTDDAAPAAPPPPMVHDVTIVTTKKLARARCMGVPPEEVGIDRNARDIKTTNYFFHEIVTKTAAALIAEGFDAEQIRGTTDYTGLDEIETIDRDTVDEHMSTVAGGVQNDAARLVKITEHYIRMDYEGNGRPCLYRVITAGDRGEILKKNGKDCIDPFDAIPFAATTPYPQTHRFFGRSLADLIMPIQREKTALKRSFLDNHYLRNNPRVEVAEKNASANTLDDLLVSRPGGVVRVKEIGGVQWQEIPDTTGSILQGLQYLDSNIESRTGQPKQAQGLDANALQNQSATAVAQVFSSSQMRMKLVARILAEGVRDAFSLLHATIRKHGQQSETVQLRNKWVNVDPRGWKTRNDMTINVGLGTGSKAQQFQQTMAIANVQKEFVEAGKTNIVGDTELYNTAAELTRIMGHKNANKFFRDPDAKDPATGQLINPPPQPKTDPKVEAIQAQSQAKQQEAAQRSQIAQEQAKLDALHQQIKGEMDAKLAAFKAALDGRMKLLGAAVATKKAVQEHKHGQQRHALDLAEREQAHHHAEARHKLDLAGDVLGVIGQAHQHDANMQAQQQAAQQQDEPGE